MASGTLGAGWEALVAQRAGYDALVDATEEIDRFCSSTDWILPLHRQLGTGSLIVQVNEGAALAVTRLPGRDRRCLLCGVDVMWGYARPVVGPDLDAGVELVERLLVDQRHDSYGLLLAGVVAHTAFAVRITDRLRMRLVSVAEPVGRRVAWLDGGMEAYLARRSPVFRRNARQAAGRAERAGVHFQWIRGGGPEVVERAIRVERASWKGRQGSGLSDPAFGRFYLDLAAGLEDTHRLRAGFAVLGRQDVGYILGAVRGDSYRGLQISYSSHFPALSLGNLLQLGQIAELVSEGIGRYDLGMDMPYKASWSDELFVTETLVLRA